MGIQHSCKHFVLGEAQMKDDWLGLGIQLPLHWICGHREEGPWVSPALTEQERTDYEATGKMRNGGLKKNEGKGETTLNKKMQGVKNERSVKWET